MSDVREMLDQLAAASPDDMRQMIGDLLSNSDLPLTDLSLALAVLDSVETNCSAVARNAEADGRHDDALMAMTVLGDIAAKVLREVRKPRPCDVGSGRAFDIRVVVQPEGFVSDWSIVADDGGGAIATNGVGRELRGTLDLCATLIAEHLGEYEKVEGT